MTLKKKKKILVRSRDTSCLQLLKTWTQFSRGRKTARHISSKTSSIGDIMSIHGAQTRGIPGISEVRGASLITSTQL